MNKDIKGLIVYLIVMFLTWLLPKAMFWGVFFNTDGNELLSNIFLTLTGIFFVLYIILPIFITYRAIKKHWSKYLDNFFNQWIRPTIILVMLLLLPITLSLMDTLDIDKWDAATFYISVIPACCLAYIVIFIHNLIKSVKRIKEYFHKNRRRINL